MKRVLTAIFVVVITVLTGAIAFHLGTSRSSRTPPPESSPSVDGGQPVARPTPTARVGVGAGPEEATSRFVDAWLSTGPDRRRAGLRATCSPRLAELLSLTDPAEVPKVRASGNPTPAAERSLGVTYVQPLSDGSAIEVDLVPDAQRDLGWLATSVRPHTS